MSLLESKMFKDGELTQIERNRTYEFYDDEQGGFANVGKEYLNRLGNQTFLLDWLTTYIPKHGELNYDRETLNADDMYEFIKKLFLDAGFKGDRSKSGFNPHYLKEWVTGRYIISKREDAFRFGFILKLNETDFAEFMLKACLMPPYNFKNIDEAVYFFCLKNGKSYFDARKIIDVIENTPVKENVYAENETAVIRNIIAGINEEKELIKFLADNKSGFERQYRSAVNELINQLKIAHLHMKGKKRITDEVINKVDITEVNISAILKEITGYDPRRISDGKKALNISISESDFPDLIKDNFPTAQKINKLINDKTLKPSENDLRKALIMLIFYNMYYKKTVKIIVMLKIFGILLMQFFIIADLYSCINAILMMQCFRSVQWVQYL